MILGEDLVLRSLVVLEHLVCCCFCALLDSPTSGIKALVRYYGRAGLNPCIESLTDCVVIICVLLVITIVQV